MLPYSFITKTVDITIKCPPSPVKYGKWNLNLSRAERHRLRDNIKILDDLSMHRLISRINTQKSGDIHDINLNKTAFDEYFLRE